MDPKVKEHIEKLLALKSKDIRVVENSSGQKRFLFNLQKPDGTNTEMEIDVPYPPPDTFAGAKQVDYGEGIKGLEYRLRGKLIFKIDGEFFSPEERFEIAKKWRKVIKDPDSYIIFSGVEVCGNPCPPVEGVICRDCERHLLKEENDKLAKYLLANFPSFIKEGSAIDNVILLLDQGKYMGYYQLPGVSYEDEGEL